VVAGSAAAAVEASVCIDTVGVETASSIINGAFVHVCNHMHTSRAVGAFYNISVSKVNVPNIQRVRIARNADRCTSHGRSLRPSVRLSIRSGVLSRGMKIRSCGLQYQVGQSF